MATTSQAPTNTTDPGSEAVDVWVEYDEENDGVNVTPTAVHKDTVVRFRNSKGHKLIEFLSPAGDDCDMVMDSKIYALRIGGTYHFKCFFIHPETGYEISPKNGGVIDVEPQRP